jgi:hypothetical protein
MPVLHPLLPLPQAAADCSPEPIPDRGAEPNLFIAGSPIASLPNCCSTQRNPNACTTTCIATQHLLLNPLLRTGRTAGVVVVVVAAGAGRPSRYALRRKACHVSLGRGAPKCESPHVNCLFQLGQYIETVFVAYHVQPFAAAYHAWHAICVPEHLIFVQLGRSHCALLNALTATTASAAQQSTWVWERKLHHIGTLRTGYTTVVHMQ